MAWQIYYTMSETPENTRNNLLVGNERNQGFTTKKQPTSEQKIHGWEVRRQKKLLTQKIVEKMTEGKTLDDYVDSLIDNAKLGNSKAIETINKGIEEQVDKSEVTVTNVAISIDL